MVLAISTLSYLYCPSRSRPRVLNPDTLWEWDLHLDVALESRAIFYDDPGSSNVSHDDSVGEDADHFAGGNVAVDLTPDR
jgi:hypothetical protein